MMIRALPAIRAACPDVLYVMVGQGWERDYLDRLVDEHHVRDAVQYRTAASDLELVDCYQQCDLFALPNRQIGWDVEGFGIVLAEAQSCGKPVLAGRSGGTVDAVDDGVTGELVDAITPEAVATAVVGFLNQPERAAAFGRRGRAWAIDRLSWHTLVPQALALFGAEESVSIDPQVQIA
jgi:phosphatidylinositol alpha-1,6-mannosyltransferase